MRTDRAFFTARARMLVRALGAAAAVMAAAVTPLAQGVSPRLAPVSEAQQTAEQQGIAREFAASSMRNALATYLHYPSLAQRLFAHMRYLSDESALPPRHREILALRTAWLTRSSYLWAHRAAQARRAGFTDEEIERVARFPDAREWNDFEAALLRAADELHQDSFISDATWAALTDQYDTNQMIDTVDTVGAFTMNAGLINSFGVQAEAAMTDRLPANIPLTLAAGRTSIRLEGKGARIPPVEGREGRGGANVFRTFVRNPPADRLRGAINSHVNSSSTLSPRHRELLLMRIGVLCRSEYEFAAHARVGRKLGMTDADVARIVAGPDAPDGDPLETALLRATDELWEDDRISDPTWQALARALDTRQLFDVLVAVGGYRSTSMLINSAGVQLDADMADYRFPPELR